jgi:NADH:ubiquinone oxidoreductase subunit E
MAITCTLHSAYIFNILYQLQKKINFLQETDLQKLKSHKLSSKYSKMIHRYCKFHLLSKGDKTIAVCVEQHEEL